MTIIVMWDVKSCTLVDGIILSENRAVSILRWENTNFAHSPYIFARIYHITNGYVSDDISFSVY